ncbi:MAG: hypothetical protein H6642_07750 [Caldilineaceae bacterium]|nr:hypothetical protein [Caldilineaceae bacterium]
MSDIKFGTDGWRGRIGDDYTFANARRCAQGFAAYLAGRGLEGATVIVGHDRRFQAEDFAAAVAEVLAGNGFVVHLTDKATPTPVISFSVPSRGGVAAVNITASHNPPQDLGFKVRDELGGAIAPDGLKIIRSLIPSRCAGHHQIMRLDEALATERILYFDAKPAYLLTLPRSSTWSPSRQQG